jgi:hypothetical protein
MKLIIVLLFATLVAVSNCQATDLVPGTLLSKMKSIAGSHSRDCGSVPLHNNPYVAIECAKDATSADKPYRVAVQLQGVDSLVWQAAARDEHGKLWEVFYDSDPSGGSGANASLTVVPCREIVFASQGQQVIECKP